MLRWGRPGFQFLSPSRVGHCHPDAASHCTELTAVDRLGGARKRCPDRQQDTTHTGGGRSQPSSSRWGEVPGHSSGTAAQGGCSGAGTGSLSCTLGTPVSVRALAEHSPWSFHRV